MIAAAPFSPSARTCMARARTFPRNGRDPSEVLPRCGRDRCRLVGRLAWPLGPEAGGRAEAASAILVRRICNVSARRARTWGGERVRLESYSEGYTAGGGRGSGGGASGATRHGIKQASKRTCWAFDPSREAKRRSSVSYSASAAAVSPIRSVMFAADSRVSARPRRL